LATYPFALAIVAYWPGPYQGNMNILNMFMHVPAFTQMLVRVALSTILIVHAFGQIGGNIEDGAKEFAPSVHRIIEWLQHDDQP
jgi:hypothetical protein